MKNAGLVVRARASLAGLRAVWKDERSFRDHVVFSAILVATLFWVSPPMWWWAIIIIAIACGWAFEAMNAAIETLCDRVHPAHDPAIGRVKDMASAAAFMVNCATGLLAVAMIVSAVT